jgi:hypothetical protein
MWYFLDTSTKVTVSSSPLSIPDLARDVTFSKSLNTLTLYQSNIWWFAGAACTKPAAGCPYQWIPPSQLQHAMNILPFIASRHTYEQWRISERISIKIHQNLMRD